MPTRLNSKGRLESKEIREFVSEPLFDPRVIRQKDPSYPRISVIVPSYNQGQFIERTFLSILNQNYPNTELIVMDGGSKDGSIEVIRKYERHIDYWTSEPDKGQPSAINKGFAIATGDLVGWQNSDDLYLPNFFYAVAESVRMDPTAQLFISNTYIIDENDNIIRRSYFTPFSLSFLIYAGWNLSSQATFITRKLIDAVGALREDIQVGFDWDWYIRVGNTVKQTVLHRSVGGCYRIHPDSKLSTYRDDSRRLINAQILLSHGIKVKTDVSRIQQNRLQRRLLRLRHLLLVGLLYYPDDSPDNRLKAPIYSVSHHVMSLLRPLVLWVLSNVGHTRIR